MLFFFRTIVAWRRLIIIAGLVTAAAAAGVSLVMTKWYRASTTVFPPETQSGLPVYAELIQNLSLPVLGPMAGGVAPETIYIDMLKSRRVGKSLVEEFGLMESYQTKTLEATMAKMQSHSRFELLENGLLVVSFEAKDPQRAADITNRMIQLLDQFNRELNLTRASRSRKFIGEQLAEREKELAKAETNLRDFQEANQTLEIDTQLNSAMEIVTDLTGQAIALEIELDILSHYTSKQSEEYQRKQREYEELVNQLRKLKVKSGKDSDLVRAFIPTLEEVPEVALEFMRLKRLVQIESTVYTMLVKEFEKARIEEARDTPTVVVMDAAEPPSRRSRPQRKLMVIAGGLVGVGWSSLLALFVTAWRENDKESGVVKDVLGPIAADFSRIFKRS